MNAIENDIRGIIDKELSSANQKFPLFASLHEAYGVISEEYDEATEELENVKRFLDLAWKQIKLNNSELAVNHISRIKYAAERLAIEASQISAMCIKAEISERTKKK